MSDFEEMSELYNKIMFDDKQRPKEKGTYVVANNFKDVQPNDDEIEHSLYVVIFLEKTSFLYQHTDPKFYVKAELTKSQLNELPATLKILKNKIKNVLK